MTAVLYDFDGIEGGRLKDVVPLCLAHRRWREIITADRRALLRESQRDNDTRKS
ncbi:MAG: hypothetical protein ACLUEQ_09035 [Cloacibacillus evryensis]